MSNNNDNPFASPNSNVDNKQFQSKNVTPKVIGIIALVLAVLIILISLLGLYLFIKADPDPRYISSWVLSKTFLNISFLSSIWVIFISVKLLQYRDIGRRLFNYYTVFTIVVTIVNVLNMPELSGIILLDRTYGSVIVIIAAILLNRKKVKDALN